MSVKQVLQLESESVSCQPVSIPFEFTRLESLPEGKTVGDSIAITPITVRTWFRIKPLLLYIDKEDREVLIADKNKYDELIFEMVCLGIHNKKGDMPDWFREVLKDNCTWEDIYILLNAVLYRVGCNPFSRTIIALEAVSPLSEVEIIALQKNSETWKKKALKAASCS